MPEKENELLMLKFDAFRRRVKPLWIIPSKSEWVEENHGVSLKDNSPEGRYPGMIVPVNEYDQIMVILPQEKFLELLEPWKKANPEFMKNIQKVIGRGKNG